jgi:hypothetical protein
MIEIPPSEFINKRFDVKVKYLYARSLELKDNEYFYKFLYEYHLQKWNRFKEKGNNFKFDSIYVKNSFEDYDIAFKNILLSIKTEGFNARKSLVPLFNNIPVNGSHRIAACLLYNVPVLCEEVLLDNKLDYSEDFFEKKGFSKNFIHVVNEKFLEFYNV